MKIWVRLIFNLIIIIGVATSQQFHGPALNCKCMDYWGCAVGGGQISSYCGISETQVCCFLKHVNVASRPSSLNNSLNETPSLCGKPSFPVLLDSKSVFAEWPWHVAILDSSRDYYLCGGALIALDKIITGAHCVIAYFHNNSQTATRISKLKIRAGEHDVSGNFEQDHHVEIPVKKITVHPNFNRQTLENDIAILRLDYPFNFTRHIRPLCLPPPPRQRGKRIRNGQISRRKILNRTCIVTGWGRESQASPTTHSIILKEVPVSLLSQSRCEKRLEENFGPTYTLPSLTTICGVDDVTKLGNNPLSQVCDGDGGGPLACLEPRSQKWILEGIVSFGVGGCGLTVYTRVESFIGWINMQ